MRDELVSHWIPFSSLNFSKFFTRLYLSGIKPGFHLFSISGDQGLFPAVASFYVIIFGELVDEDFFFSNACLRMDMQ
jgi:hypothetical protein